MPSNAIAQSIDSAVTRSETEEIVLDAVTVTGSNIRRVDAESALPVTVLNSSDIEMRTVSTGAELFASLTMSEPPGINEAQIGSQGARGDVTSMDLRGIGAGSTLMLINGRRMAPHPLTGNENGVPSLAPNANVVPVALVDRIEVLRDGASAIYGADAAAGVINSIISRHKDGGSIAGGTALTQHDGAEEFRFTASDGFTKGKTHIGVSLDVFHREDMASNDRYWGSDTDLRVTGDLPAPWNGLPVTDPETGKVQSLDNDMDNSSSITNYGQFRRGFI
ncbi:MAG: TonB-dependent receptor plug domain-containing protein [Candidatus Synoicihabitans palmerolidicus]|nr:TonB-dependent receptor plug domain-containing protein [Candidatus Synoicihabitans palmerolidicus]